MHWWLPETPLREKSLLSQCTLSLDQGGSAALEPTGSLRPKIEPPHLTDPPR